MRLCAGVVANGHKIQICSVSDAIGSGRRRERARPAPDGRGRALSLSDGIVTRLCFLSRLQTLNSLLDQD